MIPLRAACALHRPRPTIHRRLAQYGIPDDVRCDRPKKRTAPSPPSPPAAPVEYVDDTPADYGRYGGKDDSGSEWYRAADGTMKQRGKAKAPNQTTK